MARRASDRYSRTWSDPDDASAKVSAKSTALLKR
jgi:hypothetical protein